MEETQEMKMMKRRELLKGSLFAAGALVSGKAMAASVLQACSLTAPQTKGPFYPQRFPADKDSDLTIVTGHSSRAKGRVVEIHGRILDQACAPVAGALVEIWQACESGRYNHDSDPNTSAPLDPDFQYWGKATTDAQGNYHFRTIIPGAYPADESTGWWRPPHVHFKVSRRGYFELVSQMYFDGPEFEELNRKDLILKALTPAEQRAVTVKFGPDGVGNFDLVIRKA